MLEEFMKTYGLNQNEIANLLKVSQPYISSVLSGKQKLSKRCIDTLHKSQYLKSTSTYSVIKDSTLDKIISLCIDNEHMIDDQALVDFTEYFTDS